MIPVWVQVIDYRNGAYPITEMRNGTHYSEAQFLVKNALAKKLQVVNHCNLFYKTVDTFVNNFPKSFLICKKDCLVLQ